MGMNKKQKKVVVIGLGIMLLMALIPPWKCIFKDRQLPLERPGGYGILFAPPPPDKWLAAYVKSTSLTDTALKNPLYWSVRLDATRLYIQWAVIFIAMAGIVLVLKDDEETLQKGG